MSADHMSADHRPSVLERAFALADSGRFNNLNELRAALKAERYGDEQFLGSAQLRRQMAARIANAKSGSDAIQPALEPQPKRQPA